MRCCMGIAALKDRVSVFSSLVALDEVGIYTASGFGLQIIRTCRRDPHARSDEENRIAASFRQPPGPPVAGMPVAATLHDDVHGENHG